MLSYYFKNPEQGYLFHKFREISMIRVSPFPLTEKENSYTSMERVGKQIPPKYIP